MPTIKDIAAKAGVSHGTVSNVLNKRGNVSAEKIQLVEQIAKELGYKINVQAQQLRAGTAKKVCMIVPQISLNAYNSLYSGLDKYLQEHDFSVELICTGDLEFNEEKAVKKALSVNPMAVVIVSAQQKNKGSFPSDTRFFFVERKIKGMPENSVYASFSFEKAGRDMAMRCVADGHANIALFCENRRYSNYKSFINEAVDVFDDAGCSYKIFHSDDSMRFNKAFDILNSKEEFDAVIAMSSEDTEYLKKAFCYLPGQTFPPVYALTEKRIGADPYICRYELNYKLLGRMIAEQIVLSENEARTPPCSPIILENDGFYPQRTPAGKERGTIRFLTIQNMTSRAIQKLLPAFTRETGIRVNMIEASYDESYKMAQSCGTGSSYDLIRIDMAWMADLGRQIYRPLDETDPDVLWVSEQILPTLSDDYSRTGGQLYAFPLDACVQMLFYRKDLFEDELIKREFFEKHRRRLEIPKTFEEYNEVARFFTKKENPNSKTRYGAETVYGRSFLASCDFLPRLRELNADIFDAKGRINLLTPEMKHAIENYLETCRYSSGDIHSWWNGSTFHFSEGNTAMHIVFSNYASEMLHSPDSKVVGRIAYGAVPGGQPLSGGGSIGISKFSKRQEESMEFLKWLYRKDIAETITYLGGYICSRQIGKNMDILELYPWIADMERTFSSGWRNYKHENMQMFNEVTFEDILGRAIRSVASGIEDMEPALKQAQHECEDAFRKDT